MVGSMSAALAIVAMMSSAMIGETKTCKDQDALKFIGNSCIYLEVGRKRIWNESRLLCQALSNNATKWDLPKVDSLAKHKTLGEIMRNNSVDKAFWIGLVRVNGNEKQWNDPTKWLWVADNSTLASSFPNNDAPWDYGEPNGRQHDSRCVRMGFDNEMDWNDAHCEAHTAGVLVCEGTDMAIITMSNTTAAHVTTTMGTTMATSTAVTTAVISTTSTAYDNSTTTATTAVTTASSGLPLQTTVRTATLVTSTGTVGASSTINATEDNEIGQISPQSTSKAETSTALSGYVWAAIGLLLLAVVIVVSLLTVYFTKRYRKRRLQKWRIRHSSITSTSVSSKRRGMSTSKKMRKEESTKL